MAEPAPQRQIKNPRRSVDTAVVAAPVRVIPFTPPARDVLRRVHEDCERLRIPMYRQARKTYRPYLRQQWLMPSTECDAKFDAAWRSFAAKSGVSWEVIEAFRNSEAYQDALDARERYYENAAYLLGLYVARREFPRLGGGVL